MKKLIILTTITATAISFSCNHNADKKNTQTSNINIDSMVSAAQANVSADTSHSIDSMQIVKDSIKPGNDK